LTSAGSEPGRGAARIKPPEASVASRAAFRILVIV